MQAEQQTTTQTKKTTTKGKKTTKKETSEETVQLTAVAAVETPAVVEPTVSVAATEQVNTQNEQSSETEDNTQEFEFQTVLDFVNSTGDKLSEYSKLFKDRAVTKDERSKLETSFKKFNKAYSSFQTGYYEYLSKEVTSLEKKSGNKSATKKMANKDKAAIHKKLKVHPFLLEFMKLPADTMVSRSDALTAITGYVKEEKSKNPDIIVENDKKSFKIIGNLQQLFTGIEGSMKKAGLNEEMPKQIKYTQIMKYMTHCFVKDETA